MTLRSVKEQFEDPSAWWPYPISASWPNVKTRWSDIKFFGLTFEKLEVLTGFDDYRPGTGFVPSEGWRTKQIYRLTDDHRMVEVTKTEALELIKHAKKMSEEGEKV